MAWCRQCKSEYREGITACYKCGVPLVDELTNPEEGKAGKLKSKPYEREVFLVNVMSIVELTYITSMLDENDIGYRVLEKDAGQYLSIRHGRSYFGKSIYVKESQLKQAKEVVDSYRTQFEKQEELESSIETVKSKKRAVFSGITLVIIIIGAIFFGVVVG